MAISKFANRAWEKTSTTGTGSSITLDGAVDDLHFTFAEAGLQNGDVVSYIIIDGTDVELQRKQTYSVSGPTRALSRGTPSASKIGGTAGTSQINLSGNAQVLLVPFAEDFRRDEEEVPLLEFIPKSLHAAILDGTSTVDVSSGFQDAIDYVESVGGILRLPRGQIRLANSVVCDMSSAGFFDKRVSIVGAGVGATIISSTVGSTNPTLEINFADYDTQGRFHLRDFSINQDGTQYTGYGILFNDLAYARIEHISLHKFHTGLFCSDVIDLTVYDSLFTHNWVGVRGFREDNTQCNAHLYAGCVVNGNAAIGYLIDNPATLMILGGDCSHNGGNDTVNAGIFVNGNPIEGRSGLVCIGTYFERNIGNADIYVAANTGDAGAHTIQGCTFNRVDGTDFVTNNIVLDKSGSGRTILNVIGCGFDGFNDYTPNASRKYIDVINATDTNWNVNLFGNFYGSSTEAPDIGGTRASEKYGLAAYVRFNGSTGAIANSHNVASVARTSAGRYTINFKKAMASAAQCISITTEDKSFNYVVSESTTSVSIATDNSSGAPTDYTAISVMVANLDS